MTAPNFTLLYVESPAKSAAFYEMLFGLPPVEASPNFAMFVTTPGITLGLWARHDVVPASPAAAGASELGFQLGTEAEVNALAAEWEGKGVKIVQRPTRMDFGWTFLALDPDGHRLRVFAPPAA
jgi:predicted enzyme related to lactoylglutathione lyase